MSFKNHILFVLSLTFLVASCNPYPYNKSQTWVKGAKYNDTDTLYIRDFVVNYVHKEEFCITKKSRLEVREINGDSMFNLFNVSLNKFSKLKTIKLDLGINISDTSFKPNYEFRASALSENQIKVACKGFESKKVLIPFVQVCTVNQNSSTLCLLMGGGGESESLFISSIVISIYIVDNETSIPQVVNKTNLIF